MSNNNLRNLISSIDSSNPYNSNNINNIYTTNGTEYNNWSSITTTINKSEIEFELFDSKYVIDSLSPSLDIVFISKLDILGWDYFLKLEKNGLFNTYYNNIMSLDMYYFLVENRTTFDRKFKIKKI